MPSGKPVRIASEAQALVPDVEEIRLQDARLQQSWDNRLFRIPLRAKMPSLKASWAMHIKG
jgi:hypothetical protein